MLAKLYFFAPFVTKVIGVYQWCNDCMSMWHMGWDGRIIACLSANIILCTLQ